MKLGIVIFPSKPLQDLANSYRKRYDPNYSLIPPHITLVGPFDGKDEQINDTAQKLKKIGKNYNPVQIKVLKFSSFKPVNNVIYLKLEQNINLEQLQKSLISVVDQYKPEYPFVPHITVAQKLSDDEHSDIYGSLRMQQVYHEETVDRFHLLYQLENRSWTVYETFHLGKED